MRIALGISYRGTAFQGWQSQLNGLTVQDALQAALARFCAVDGAIDVACAGRTDTGVHANSQVVHFDTALEREAFSWVRGVNAFLPADIRVNWARAVPPEFHARFSAHRRRYRYVLRQATVQPPQSAGLVGWTHYALDRQALQTAVQHWLGTHDFSAFRSSQCQAATPVKTLYRFDIAEHADARGTWWVFTLEANAFLHHMVRNLIGMLIYIGAGRHPPKWARDVLESRNRTQAAPTFMACGLTLDGVQYPPEFALDDLTWVETPIILA
jgi:tRNA pseudouridine38-40 synthase